MRTRKSTTAAIICTERLLSDFEAPPIPPDVVHRLEYPLNALMRHRPLVERSNRLMVVGKTIQHAPLLSVQHLPSSARSNFLQKTRTFLGRPTGSVQLRRRYASKSTERSNCNRFCFVICRRLAVHPNRSGHRSEKSLDPAFACRALFALCITQCRQPASGRGEEARHRSHKFTR